MFYIYTYIYNLYLSIYIFIYIYIIYIYYTYIHIYIYVYIYIYIYIYIDREIDRQTDIDIYIYRYIYRYIDRYIDRYRCRYPFGLSVDREGRERWWFQHSVSQLQVCLSKEGAENVSWPWLPPLRGWGGLNMPFTGKFIYSLPFHLATAHSL